MFLPILFNIYILKKYPYFVLSPYMTTNLSNIPYMHYYSSISILIDPDACYFYPHDTPQGGCAPPHWLAGPCELRRSTPAERKWRLDAW
jgi:hypothetical protein